MAALGLGCDADYVDYEIVDETDGKYDTAASAWYSGSPSEHDPGPNADWAKVFSEVPNYRTVSRNHGATWLVPDPVTGKTKLQTVNEARAAKVPAMDPIPEYTFTKDKFRFEMGPIFYRGRLDGTARVLIVGQDAATDEALGHRAFVGGTGQKVQGWLNQIGITKSYVALNTFIYSIYEQYDEFTRELATQGPIKDYRNRVMKKAWDENKIELIISFGSAAHESVRIFRDQMLGGKLPTNVQWVQMLHPGGAAADKEAVPQGEINLAAVQPIADSFAKGWNTVWTRRSTNYGWLKPDSDGKKYKGAKYYYSSNDVPYRDLPFGISKEIGRGSTKSERAGSGMQVQLRSSLGVRYEAPVVAYPKTATKSSSGFAYGSLDEVSWEPHKVGAEIFDKGPSAEWVQLHSETPSVTTVETESGVSLATDFIEPIWVRGRLDGTAKTLVIAQDFGVDQVVAGRALVGEAGQKLHHLLKNAGMTTTDYVMMNVFPFPLSNVAAESVPALAASPSLAAHRARIIEKLLASGTITTVLTVGPLAQDAWEPFATAFTGLVIPMTTHTDANVLTSWNEALAKLKTVFLASRVYNYTATTFSTKRVAIPRIDLPWGVPMWFGTSGDLSQHPHESWLFWNAPKWVNLEKPSQTWTGVTQEPAPSP